MSEGYRRPWQAWAGAAAIAVVAVIAAVVLVLASRHTSELDSDRTARAAVADAVGPVSDALRTTLTADAADAGTGRLVAYGESGASGVPAAIAVEARDSGMPVLADTGKGIVVVATYDTPTVPGSVALRRTHVTGLRVAPLDLSRTLDRLRPPGGGIALAGPDHTVASLPATRPSGRPGYDVALAPQPAPQWTLTTWGAAPSVPGGSWLAVLGLLVLGLGSAAISSAATTGRGAASRSSHACRSRARPRQPWPRWPSTASTSPTCSPR